MVDNLAKKSNHHLTDEFAYFPRIEFIAADGRTYRVQGDVGTRKEWPLGRIVPVRYRPANPNHASIAKGWQRLMFSAFFIAAAALVWSVVLK